MGWPYIRRLQRAQVTSPDRAYRRLVLRRWFGWSVGAGGADALGCHEGLQVDDRVVHLFGRPDPFGLVVPSHHRFLAEGDVVDVDEDFVTALAVPDLATGVAGVVEDRPDGALGPCPRALARWRLRSGSCTLGDGMPSLMSPSAMA